MTAEMYGHMLQMIRIKGDRTGHETSHHQHIPYQRRGDRRTSRRVRVGNGGGDDFSGSQLRWIVSSSAGGGFDTTTRQLEPHFTEELGANAVVENLEGGGYCDRSPDAR